MELGLPQSVYLHCLHGKNRIFQSGFLISDIGSIAIYSRHPDAFPKSNPPLQPVALLSVAFLRWMFAKFEKLLHRCPSWFWDWTRRSNKCVNSVMRHVFQPDQSMSLYYHSIQHWPHIDLFIDFHTSFHLGTRCSDSSWFCDRFISVSTQRPGTCESWESRGSCSRSNLKIQWLP